MANLTYGTADSPVGTLLLVAGKTGLVRLVYARGEAAEDEPDRIAAAISPQIVEDQDSVGAARAQLDEYFADTRREFELRVDLAAVGAFGRDVLQAAAAIPYGQTLTYGALADLIGRPRASRAVGNALAANPVPIVVPCHRVLRMDGGRGGYAGGAEIKRVLLDIEDGRREGPPAVS